MVSHFLKKLTRPALIAGTLFIQQTVHAHLSVDHANELGTPETVELQVIDLPSGLPEKCQIKVIRQGQELSLILKKTSYRSENFRIICVSENGVEEIEAPPVCHYTGFIEGIEGSFVSGSVTKDGLELRVVDPSGNWEIIPPNAAKGETLHTVCDEMAPVLSEETFNIEFTPKMKLENEAIAASKQKKTKTEDTSSSVTTKAATSPNTVEVRKAIIGFDIDSAAWLSTDTSRGFNQEMTRVMSTVNGGVSLLNETFISAALVQHELGTVIVRMDAASDPYSETNLPRTGRPSPENPEGQGDLLLERFRDVWNGNSFGGKYEIPPNQNHDLAHAITRRTLGSASGLAWVGTAGQSESLRYNIGTTSSQFGLNFWRGVFRHEVGHNWGMNHGDGCDVEFRPQGDSFSVGMCGGDRSRANSRESALAIAQRNSNLADFDLIPQNEVPQRIMYSPLDRYEASVGGGPIVLDVLANDFDPNNDIFELNDIFLYAVDGLPADRSSNDNPITSRRGGSIQVQRGTGPGGRDVVLYTPPSTFDPNETEDQFLYFLRSPVSSGTGYGNVIVTLIPSITPKPINPETYLAHSSEQMSFDAFHPQWQYGSMTQAGVFTPFTTANAVEGPGYVGGQGNLILRPAPVANDTRPVIGPYYTLTGTNNLKAVRRWTSDYLGEVEIEYDVRLLQTSGSFTAQIVVNGSILWSQPFDVQSNSLRKAGSVRATLAVGDVVDFISDPFGSNSNDGSSEGDDHVFIGRVVRADRAYRDPALLFHYPFDENSEMPRSLGDPSTDSRYYTLDVSGNNNHASLYLGNVNQAWLPGEISNAANVANAQLFRDNKGNVGDGADELTMSAWVRPESIRSNSSFISSTGPTYFSLMHSGADGQPLEFRAHGNSLKAPRTPTGKWVHVTGVWKGNTRNGTGRFQRLYINGELAAEDITSISGAPVDVSNWIIGRDREEFDGNRDRRFNGAIDDIAVWTRVLNDREVRSLYLQGRFALQFDGDGDQISADGSPIANGSEEVTYSVWVTPSDKDPNDGVFTVADNSGQFWGIILGTDNAVFEFRANNQSLRDTTENSAAVNETAHVVATWKKRNNSSGVPGEQRLYVNGQEVNSLPANDVGANIPNVMLGQDRSTTSRQFTGMLAEPLLLNRELSAAEVLALYNRGIYNSDASHGSFTAIGTIGVNSTGSLYAEGSDIISMSSGANAGTDGSSDGSSDGFEFASRPHTGNGTASSQVYAIEANANAVKSGVMWRENEATNARFVMIFQEVDGTIRMQSRSATGASSSLSSQMFAAADGAQIRLARVGNDFTGQVSQNGQTWQTIDIVTIPMANDALVGVATVQATTGRSTGVFNDFALTSLIDPTLDPNADSDGDGLPNGFELQYYGHITANTDGSGDLDGDGQNDAAEFIAGTDANDNNSTFGFTTNGIDPLSSSQIRLTWFSEPDRTYELWTSQTLAPDSWMKVGNDIVPSAEDTSSIIVDLNQEEDHRFYQIRVAQP